MIDRVRRLARSIMPPYLMTPEQIEHRAVAATEGINDDVST